MKVKPHIPVEFLDTIVASINHLLQDLTREQRQGFLKWLQNHTQNNDAYLEDINGFLFEWFQSLPSKQTIKEFDLCKSEIAWWQKRTTEEIRQIEQ